MKIQKPILDVLQSDYRGLSTELKKKYVPIKEACEKAIIKLREICDDLNISLNIGKDLILPYVLACETKQHNLISISLMGLQKLILYQLLNEESSYIVVDILKNLVINSVEEIRVLQTIIVLLTSNQIIKHEHLALTLVMCFNLNFKNYITDQSIVAKDKEISTISSTAAATIQQLISVVFDRISFEQIDPNKVTSNSDSGRKATHHDLPPYSQDAYLLFQDLCLMANGETTKWLLELPQISRNVPLELIEGILNKFSSIFIQIPQFHSLLKDQVCPLIIKLFSPNVKYNNNRHTIATSPGVAGHNGNNSIEKPLFPINLRLLRIVSVIIDRFHDYLIMECEIFISMLLKFTDPEKPLWLRVITLETLYKLFLKIDILRSICRNYDLKSHSSKIYHMLIDTLQNNIRTEFLETDDKREIIGVNNTSTHVNNPQSPSLDIAFYIHDKVVQLSTFISPKQFKPLYFEMLDKDEAPAISEKYLITLLHVCLLDLVDTLTLHIVQSSTQIPSKIDEISLKLIQYSWLQILSSLTILLDATQSQILIDSLTNSMNKMIKICGLCDLSDPKMAFITSLCKASLPIHYPYIKQILCQDETNGSPILENKNENIALKDHRAITTFSFSHKSERCFIALLELIREDGKMLCSTWKIMLATIHHITLIMGFKLPVYHRVYYDNKGAPKSTLQPQKVSTPVTNGENNVKSNNNKIGFNTANGGTQDVATTQSNYPFSSRIQNLLTNLFENSLNYSEKNLLNLFDALIELSEQVAEYTTTYKEPTHMPSLFPLSKLFEVAHLNTFRASLYWQAVVQSYICDDVIIDEIGNHENMKIKEFCDENLILLIRFALDKKLLDFENQEKKNDDHSPSFDNSRCDAQVSILAIFSPLLSVIAKCPNKLSELKISHLSALLSLLREKGKSIILNSNTRFSTVSNAMSCQDEHSLGRNESIDCLSSLINTLGSVADNQTIIVQSPPSKKDVKIGDDILVDHMKETKLQASDNNINSSNCISTAFQCLCLLINDFLPHFSANCLKNCISVVSKYSAQEVHLNISLTSIGLLWNISDYLHQNYEKLYYKLQHDENDLIHSNTLESYFKVDSDQIHPNIKNMDLNPISKNEMNTDNDIDYTPNTIWMCLYSKLACSCLDHRPSVRKSACQTLFSTLEAHGLLLGPDSSRIFIRKILFPLLDHVRINAINASTQKSQNLLRKNNPSLLIHHSRDTPIKQWSETQTMALEGLARIFTNRHIALDAIDFYESWCWVMLYIENCVLSTESSEISLAAIKCFKEMSELNLNEIYSKTEDKNLDDYLVKSVSQLWRTWLSMSFLSFPPSLSLLPKIVQKICSCGHRCADLLFDQSLYQAISKLITDNTNNNTPFLQTEAVETLHEVFEIVAQSQNEPITQRGLVVYKDFVLNMQEFSLNIFAFGDNGDIEKRNDSKSPNLENFGSTCIDILTRLYSITNDNFKPYMNIEKHIDNLMRGFCHKYSLNRSTIVTLWESTRVVFSKRFYNFSYENSQGKHILQKLLVLLRIILYGTVSTDDANKPFNQQHHKKLSFSSDEHPSSPSASFPPNNLYNSQSPLPAVILNDSRQNFKVREELEFYSDLKIKTVTDLIWKECLFPNLLSSVDHSIRHLNNTPVSGEVTLPTDFIKGLLELLVEGCVDNVSSYESSGTDKTHFSSHIHTTSHTNFPNIMTAHTINDKFIGSCLDSIYKLALSPRILDTYTPNINTLPILLLLDRCENVLKNYLKDEEVWAKYPLPKIRLIEITSTLTTLTKLLSFLQQNDLPNKQNNSLIWDRILNIYTLLVNCMLSNSRQICSYLQNALKQYTAFLNPPPSFLPR